MLFTITMQKTNSQAATTTTMTSALLADMKYYVQYATASYCNSETSLVGSKVACASGGCPQLVANSVTNYAYMGYVIYQHSFTPQLTICRFDQSQVEGFVGIDPAKKQIVISYKGTKSISNFIAEYVSQRCCGWLSIAD